MMSSGKIGIFDSGVGGLTVARKIIAALPQSSLLYFGDTKYVPYGAREAAEVVRLIERICRYLLEQEAEVLVMACNTSSALAYKPVCSWSPVPVVGIIEAAAKAAARLSRNGKIGVISNALTAGSGAYEEAVSRYRPQAQVWAQGCPKLVPLVESGQTSGVAARESLREYIAPLLENGIDTLVFGCTHYPFFRSTIADMWGDSLQLIDPADFVAQELCELGFGNRGSGERTYEVSGQPVEFARVARQLLGWDLGTVRRALDD